MAPSAAQPRRLLDLNGELLAAIFALAQREADEAYVAAYHVHAPQRMPLVCRTLRQFTLHNGKSKPVLLVPLLRADGVTPLFFTDAEWAAYFDATQRASGDLHLVSPSPTTPFDVGAHLESLGLVAPSPVEPFADLGGGFVVDSVFRPHVKYAPCMWSLMRCASALRQKQLLHRIAAMELRVCFPLTLDGNPPSIAVDFPQDHFMTMDWSVSLMMLFAFTDNLRSLSVRLGAFPGMEAGPNHQVGKAQRTLFMDACLPIASALRTSPPLHVLRFDTEVPDVNFDDFILHFLLQATSPLDAPRPSSFRTGNRHVFWSVLHSDKALSPVVPIRAHCVQLAHVGVWCEERAVHMMALLGVERLELLGRNRFEAAIDRLYANAFNRAAERRTTPMTFLCADYVLDPPLPAWLTVATRGA